MPVADWRKQFLEWKRHVKWDTASIHMGIRYACGITPAGQGKCSKDHDQYHGQPLVERSVFCSWQIEIESEQADVHQAFLTIFCLKATFLIHWKCVRG